MKKHVFAMMTTERQKTRFLEKGHFGGLFWVYFGPFATISYMTKNVIFAIFFRKRVNLGILSVNVQKGPFFEVKNHNFRQKTAIFDDFRSNFGPIWKSPRTCLIEHRKISKNDRFCVKIWKIMDFYEFCPFSGQNLVWVLKKLHLSVKNCTLV